METNHNSHATGNQENDRDSDFEREENAFSQPEDYEDENGAGGQLGTHDDASTDDSEFENDNPGGAGSTGSAATNEDDMD